MLTADSSLWRLVAVASEHQCKPTWASLAGENFLKSWIWLYFKNCGRPDLPALTHSGPCQTLSNRNISRIDNLFLLHKIFIIFLTSKILIYETIKYYQTCIFCLVPETWSLDTMLFSSSSEMLQETWTDLRGILVCFDLWPDKLSCLGPKSTCSTVILRKIPTKIVHLMSPQINRTPS